MQEPTPRSQAELCQGCSPEAKSSTNGLTDLTALNLEIVFGIVSPGQKPNTGDCGKQLVPTVKAITVNRNSKLSILNQAALESILTIPNNILQTYWEKKMNWYLFEVHEQQLLSVSRPWMQPEREKTNKNPTCATALAPRDLEDTAHGGDSASPAAPTDSRWRRSLRVGLNWANFKKQMSLSINNSQTALCKFFFYFHIYITMCPLKGPNSKVAPFCVPRTQKSSYCTFTKALCFCKLRLWWISIRQTISKGMVTSIFPAYKQASFFPLTVQLQTRSTLITFRL